MEDGEIASNLDARNEDNSGTVYSPSIEWPGDVEDFSELMPAGESRALPGLPTPSSSLRLLVQRSPVLRRQHKLALLDGYLEIQIGRDIAPAGSDTPRIRLKELEVSKLHATIYWDQGRAQWSIVDMGSKHGTFVRSATAPSATSSAVAEGVDEKGFRLSAPRVASMPRTLHHLDRLTIGGTTFLIHVHEDRTPCPGCSPQADQEIPLFLHRTPNSDSGTSKKRAANVLGMDPIEPARPQQRDPKQALTALKRSLLSSRVPALSSPDSPNLQYVDRSAKRRALHPDHTPVTTPSAGSSRVPFPAVSASAPPVPAAPPPPPAPLASTNVGHRLLIKQGWQPGTALGESSSDRGGLVAPLDPPTTVGRAGIGAPVRSAGPLVTQEGGSWRNAGKKRRWDEIRSSGGQ
ncbi:hypothetical protein OH76DRAFT_1451466 [Lentinus brumalis]|uniref:SMAD/FHA domain-containing protein n=1 Tax=Lentinus brumalis TaxID=2498619 RepID=A0A371DYI6_9APHY|nr:hypothetical protein OH76DRAFT_1451466 [Polyporus brumalis]